MRSFEKISNFPIKVRSRTAIGMSWFDTRLILKLTGIDTEGTRNRWLRMTFTIAYPTLLASGYCFCLEAIFALIVRNAFWGILMFQVLISSCLWIAAWTRRKKLRGFMGEFHETAQSLDCRRNGRWHLKLLIGFAVVSVIPLSAAEAYFLELGRLSSDVDAMFDLQHFGSSNPTADKLLTAFCILSCNVLSFQLPLLLTCLHCSIYDQCRALVSAFDLSLRPLAVTSRLGRADVAKKSLQLARMSKLLSGLDKLLSPVNLMLTGLEMLTLFVTLFIITGPGAGNSGGHVLLNKIVGIFFPVLGLLLLNHHAGDIAKLLGRLQETLRDLQHSRCLHGDDDGLLRLMAQWRFPAMTAGSVFKLNWSLSVSCIGAALTYSLMLLTTFEKRD